MIKAQIARVSESSTMGKDSFLQSFQMQLKIDEISDFSSNSFGRAYELMSKTNQFKPTGKRWSKSEFSDFFESGGLIIKATVSDRFTNYILVAIATTRNGIIKQFFVSCRVCGLGIVDRRGKGTPLAV